jgi:hypothetical protein
LENETNPSPVQVQPQVQVQAPAPAAFDPRRRIRELLSIPERDRTDAEWDELNELEIQTAPGNRASNQPANAGYSGKPAGFHGKNRPKGKPGGQGRPQQSKPGHNPNNNPNNKPRPA